jgi:LacI family transcriptional regulator
MAIKQKDIAEKLGVSIALVSRVLSGRAEEIGIAAGTIRRVVDAAAEMGYVPSAAALSLKGKATRTIGVVVYDFKDPFFGAIVEQLLAQAHDHDYSLILTGFINRTPQEQNLQPLYKHAIDGLIVIGTDFEAHWLKNFRHLPVTRIGHGRDDERSVQISVDEKAAAGLLIEHLMNRGKTRPACLCADLPAHRFRQDLFAAAARTAGVALETVPSSERIAFSAGMQAAQTIIDADAETDALICATDLVAMGALNTLHRQGIAVPGRIAVTGFDDIPAAAQFIPPLTTIRQPIRKIADQAFAAVMNPEHPGHFFLPVELVVRQTA